MPESRDRGTRTVVLVEGESDLRALATLARRLGRDLDAEDAELVAMGGVTNLRRHLSEISAMPVPPRVLGLFDVGEAATVSRMLAGSGRPRASTLAELEALGFFACSLDLEDELVRAAGPAVIEEVLAEHRELDRFRSFQRQPAQRDRPTAAQLRRFAGTASGRKTRFAADVVEVLPLDRMPAPLVGVLDAVVAS